MVDVIATDDVVKTQVAPAATAKRRNPLWMRQLTPGQILRHVILIAMMFVVLMPFVWMLLDAFKTYDDLMRNPGMWPDPFTLQNFEEIFLLTPFASAFVNSLVLAVAKVVAACATSLVLGYIFAKYRFPGRGLLFGLILSTMLIPFTAIFIPLYLTMSEFGLLNSIEGLFVISIFSGFGTFLLRQWLLGLPDSYIEAARVDGAGEFRIMFRIIAPMAGAPLAALAVFTFLGSWDDFLFPNIVLTDPEVRTIPLALAGLKSLYWERYEIFAAGAMVTVVPVMILYGFLQKYFISGLTGGIKG